MKDTVKLNETREVRGRNCSIETKDDGLEHTFDEAELAAGPAAAIRTAISDGIKAIREQASPATIARRKRAREALARGEAWAVERYAGRRPGATDRLFNDSGTLADGLKVVPQADGSMAITAPPNRGDNPTDFTGSEMSQMAQKLVELVPALKDPTADPKVRAAIEASAAKVVTVRRK